MKAEIYFDNSATTRPYDEVIEYMTYLNKEVYGNPSSLHRKGMEAEKVLKETREIIAKAVGSKHGEIYFTSGGTESNNIAIMGYLKANHRLGKHIIASKIEHPAVLEVFKHLEGEYKIDFLDVDNAGKVRLDELESLVTDDTALISIMAVNNEAGTIQPITDIVRTARSKNPNIAIHVDAVQAFGKLNINVKKLGIDMLSISGHKIHGPKGIGALFIDEKRKVQPIAFGGGQELSLRSGTENVPAIGGLGLAAKKAFEAIKENYDRVSELSDYFRKRINECIDGAVIISPEDALPYILTVSFPRLKAEVLLHHLEDKNIYVSTGSACSSKKKNHSHVLTAMNVDTSLIDSVIRFSFSCFNTIEEVDETMEVLLETIPRIQYRIGG